ncbi:MAG TPA: cysteine synthase family protein [Herpetosiphonaceae bacterium]|nr:cysteine synthase family protein [Herpetosiphonaceae bacterium]
MTTNVLSRSAVLSQPEVRSGALVEMIGDTPLLPLRNIAPDLPADVEVYGKAEWHNPGGSVKDRAALWMIRDGERRGLLRPGMRIADATSGNTGIAYATVAAVLGYGVTLTMPENASPERKRTLRALGAEVILTDAQQGMELSIKTIRERVAAHPELYFYPDQYNNPANAEAHYQTTGREVWQQTDGRVTHFVTALGTSGTFMGAGRRLRELNPHVQLVGVQPDGPYHAIEGVKHMATTPSVPGIYDPDFADDFVEIPSEAAFEMARALARVEGLLVGISAAANVAAAIEVARRIERGVVVTVLCDSASKYLSERFWDETDEVGGSGDGI